MGIIFGRTKERNRSQNSQKASMETEEYKTRIALLYEIAREASSVPEVSKLLERILRVSQQTIGASAASLMLIDEKKGELYFQVALGNAGTTLKQMRMPTDSGIAGWVVRKATPVLANDLITDSRFDRNIDEVTGFVTESIIAVPLIRGQKVIGVLEVLNKNKGGKFTEQDLRVLQGFASTEALILLVSMAVTAINNINTLVLNQALINGYRSTVEAWAASVDTMDSYGYAHSQRVREYTMLAANGLSLSPQELQAIEFGALLHDIGKIGIDSNILCKAGSLTDEEWRVMQEHSLRGADIVGEIPFLEKAKDIVLYHHERYDGKGYPERLKGDKIPIGARLVAVADAFDTMTTDHSYRRALSVEGAMSELVDGIGTQFCPQAVELFVSEFKKCRVKLADEEDDRPAPQKAAEADEINEAAGVDEITAVNEATEVIEATGANEAAEVIETAEVIEATEVNEVTGVNEVTEVNEVTKVKKGKKSAPTRRETPSLVSEIFKGDVRLVVPFTVGAKEVRRFKEQLEKVENLKIILMGGSEEEGHIILLTVQKPTTLIGIINEMPAVANVEKHGKDIIVTLKNPRG